MLAAIWIGSFFSSISSNSVNVILPRIGEWGSLGVLDLQWVMLLPLITVSAILLVTGRMGDIFGHQRIYLAGLALVGLGSLICAVAPSFTYLLAGRGIQGLGLAMTTSSSMALVSLVAREGRRGRALGLIATSTYLGLTLGPTIGGMLDSFGGFQLVFWLQVPLMLGAGAFFKLSFPSEEPRRGERTPLDILGTLLLIVSLTLICLPLARWEAWGSHSLLTWGTFVGGTILAAGFILHQRRATYPLLDLSLFRDRTLSSATVGAFLNYVAIFQIIFLLPFFLLDVLKLDSRSAGLIMSVMPISMALVTAPSGNLSDRLGSRGLSALGMVILSGGLVVLATLTGPGAMTWLIVGLVLTGIGTGVFISPNTNSLLSAAPRGKQGVASGLMALARNLGMLAGTTLSASIYSIVMASQVAAGVTPVDAGVHGMHLAYGFGAAVAGIGALVVLIRPRTGRK